MPTVLQSMTHVPVEIMSLTAPLATGPPSASSNQRCPIMTTEWQDALKEAEGPQENLVLGTQLPATSQGRGARAGLESLLGFWRL